MNVSRPRRGLPGPAAPPPGRGPLLSFVLALFALVGASPAEGGVDTAELEAFLDGTWAVQSRRFHAPGAVFVWVEDGAVRFAKGWGVADVETRRPVEPERTLFRVASLSKLFTATAAMQLRERGLLDFDVDVNDYLEGVRVPDHPSGPVTMAHLLTHGAGFDDRNIGMGTYERAEALPLAKYLAARLPPRVLPAGDVVSYSNHGVGLAGLVVEQRAGRAFAAYVRERLFVPLGIERADWGDARHPDTVRATGYQWRDGRLHPRPANAFSQLAPAAALAITAADMARFMLAHLQGGRLGEARILREESVREMQSVQLAGHPDLGGWGYGFEVAERNGRHTASHDGWTDGVCSTLVLLPEEGAGFFASTSVDCRPGLLDVLDEAILDRFFPPMTRDEPPAVSAAPPSAAVAELRRLAGAYWPSRHSRTTVERGWTLTSEVRVEVAPDGTLAVLRPGLDPLRVRRAGPLRFDEIDGDRRVAFRERDGRVTHLFVGPYGYERVPWWDTVAATAWVQGASVLVLLSALVAWPRRAVRGRLRRNRVRQAAVPARTPGWLRVARGLGALVAAAYLAWFVGIAAYFSEVNPFDLVRGEVRGLRLLLLLPLVGTLLTPPLLFLAGCVAARRVGSVGERWHHALIAGAAALLALSALHWNWLAPGL